MFAAGGVGAAVGGRDHVRLVVKLPLQSRFDLVDGRIVRLFREQETQRHLGIHIRLGALDDVVDPALEIIENPAKVLARHGMLVIAAGGDHQMGHTVDFLLQIQPLMWRAGRIDAPERLLVGFPQIL
nr:hypothetical protein [Alloalcanivorax balearicus]